MDNFIYDIPTKVYFGKDEEMKVGKIIAGLGAKKVLIHYGGGSAVRSGLIDKVKGCLDAEGIAHVELGGVVANPQARRVVYARASRRFGVPPQSGGTALAYRFGSALRICGQRKRGCRTAHGIYAPRRIIFKETVRLFCLPSA